MDSLWFNQHVILELALRATSPKNVPPSNTSTRTISLLEDYLEDNPHTSLFYDLARAIYEGVYNSEISGENIVISEEDLDTVARQFKKCLSVFRELETDEELIVKVLFGCMKNSYIKTGTTREIDSRIMFVPIDDSCSMGEMYDFNQIRDWESFASLVKSRLKLSTEL